MRMVSEKYKQIFEREKKKERTEHSKLPEKYLNMVVRNHLSMKHIK